MLASKPSNEDALRILFSGDLSITGVYRTPVTQGKEIFDRQLLDLFARHHFTVVNLEGPTTLGKNYRRPDVNIVSPPETVPYLVSRGIRIFNCANNHMFDCGIEGFTDTVRAIDATGGRYFGAGANVDDASRPLFLTHGNVTVALLGICNHRSGGVATETSSGIFYDSSLADVTRLIRYAREKADYIILNYHAGEEYTTVPMPTRRLRMLRYAELGVDAIIGHHSHVMQGHEQYRGCEIFYSLGNFVFDVDSFGTKQFTDRSALVSLSIDTRGIHVEFIPVVCDLEKELVSLGPSAFRDHIRRISDFSNYGERWRQDAYRLMFQSGHQRETSSTFVGRNQSGRHRRRWQRFFHPMWHISQLRQLTHTYRRPILIAAYDEAIRRFLRRMTGPLRRGSRP